MFNVFAFVVFNVFLGKLCEEIRETFKERKEFDWKEKNREMRQSLLTNDRIIISEPENKKTTISCKYCNQTDEENNK